MRRLAGVALTTKEIASISGHLSLREIERYTAAADQKKLSRGRYRQAAKETLVSNSGVKSVALPNSPAKSIPCSV